VTRIPLARTKGQLAGGGAYCGGLPHGLLILSPVISAFSLVLHMVMRLRQQCQVWGHPQNPGLLDVYLRTMVYQYSGCPYFASWSSQWSEEIGMVTASNLAWFRAVSNSVRHLRNVWIENHLSPSLAGCLYCRTSRAIHSGHKYWRMPPTGAVHAKRNAH